MGRRKWKTLGEIPAFINSGNQKSTGATKRNKSREKWIWEYGRMKENEMNILTFGVTSFEILLIPGW